MENKDLLNIKKKCESIIAAVNNDSTHSIIKKLLLKNSFNYLINDISLKIHKENKDFLDIEVSLDLIRKSIWELDDLLDQDLLNKRNDQKFINSYTEVRILIIDFYENIINLFPDKIIKIPRNLWLYKKLIADDKKYGYPILARPYKNLNLPAPPERESFFIENMGDINNVLSHLLQRSKPVYCISGEKHGDENAGIGKTTLAKEIISYLKSDTVLSDYEYLKDQTITCDYIYEARKKYADGIIWITLESHKKSKENYIKLIADALEIEYFPKHEEDGDELEIIKLINTAKRNFVLTRINPKSPQDIDLELTIKHYFQQNKELESKIENVVRQQYSKKSHLTQDNIDILEKTGDFTKDATFAILKESKEEFEEQKRIEHTKVDCLEKIALILNSKKVLIVLDNVEQDRETFEYLYLRLRDFTSLLVTCRIELPGIDTLKLKGFDLTSGKKYFYKFREEDNSIPKKNLEKVLELLKFNPFCLSLLGNNMAANVDQVFSTIIHELEEVTPYDKTTVRRIIVCLDATNALLEEEKSILFDASLFFDQHFSAKELSYFYPSIFPAEIQKLVHEIYNDKRIIRIYEETKGQETLYEFQQGVKTYLDQWFEIKEKIRSLDIDLAESIIRDKITKTRKHHKSTNYQIDKIAHSIDKYRYQTYLKSKLKIEKQEIYFGDLLFDYYGYKEEKRFFTQKALFNSTQKHLSYYEYIDVSNEIDEYKYELALIKITNYLRENYIKLKSHGFKSGLNSLLHSIHMSFDSKYLLDTLISEFTSKFKDPLQNKLNIIQGLMVYQLYFGIKENFTKYSYLLNENNPILDKQFGSLNIEYNYSIYQDIEIAKSAQKKLLKLLPENYNNFIEERIAIVKIPFLLYEENYNEAKNLLDLILCDKNITDLLVDELKLLEWRGKIAIGLKNEKETLKFLRIVDEKIKQRGKLDYHLLKFKLLALKAYISQDFSSAIKNIEEAIDSCKLHNIKFFPELKHLRSKIISKIGADYEKIKSNLKIRGLYILPRFFNLPKTYIDEDGKNMILIQEGRFFKQSGKLNILLEPDYCLQLGKKFIANKLRVTTLNMNEEELIYPFYVDEEPVTEAEFIEFFSNLPLNEALQFPKFNAQNVLKYAKVKGKYPIIDIEWQKIYGQFNTNLNIPKIKIENEEKYKQFQSIISQTTFENNNIDFIKKKLLGLKKSDAKILIGEIEYPVNLCISIAYSLSCDNVKKKIDLLINLRNNPEKEEEIFHIIQTSNTDVISIFEHEDPLTLEMAFNSQKNIWSIALTYLLELEDSFSLIQSGSTEAVLLEKETDVPKLFRKEATDFNCEFHQNEASSSQFLPFRCVKMWYDVIND